MLQVLDYVIWFTTDVNLPYYYISLKSVKHEKALASNSNNVAYHYIKPLINEKLKFTSGFIKKKIQTLKTIRNVTLYPIVSSYILNPRLTSRTDPRHAQGLYWRGKGGEQPKHKAGGTQQTTGVVAPSARANGAVHRTFIALFTGTPKAQGLGHSP